MRHNNGTTLLLADCLGHKPLPLGSMSVNKLFRH